MGLKTKIKNDMWHVNYIIPFTVKYLQGGKANYIRRSIPVIAKLKVVKGKGKRDIATDINALMKSISLHALDNSSFFYWIDEYKTIAVRGNILSNFTLDYNRIIVEPFDSVADRAVSVGGIYGSRAQVTKEAIHVLRDRCLSAIKAEHRNNEKKGILCEEFSILLETPTRHFHEGLQRILFFNQYLWQTRHGLNGLGRLDKILGALYQSDMNDGIITRDAAYEMICDFLQVLHKWYSYKSSALLGDIGQIIILGGVEEDGGYFHNDLTELFLKAQAEVLQPDPKVLLRVSKNMPDELMKKAVQFLTAKTGSPLFSNDDVIIPVLEESGIPREDAISYCVSACWEPYIPGKSLDQNNIKTFDFFKPLDACLNEENEVKSFNDLVKLYDLSLQKEWREFLKSLDEFVWACDPLVSMLTNGCNESGKDISEGGAVYSNYGVTSVGMASTCDTLLNIKKLVFDEKECSLKELNERRKNNFKGCLDTLAMLKNLPHRFGHDDEEAIELVNHIISVSNSEVKRYSNPLGGKVKFGLSSPNYIKSAKKAPADFAGRTIGSPYSTHISALDASYTEVVRFAGKIDYSGYCFNGNVIDFFVTPGLIDNNIEQFTQYMRASTVLGFFQMQMNIVDSATLIDAKVHPEKYPGLIVRVWGFSAYFNDLPEDYKDVLIARARENEVLSN